MTERECGREGRQLCKHRQENTHPFGLVQPVTHDALDEILEFFQHIERSLENRLLFPGPYYPVWTTGGETMLYYHDKILGLQLLTIADSEPFHSGS